MSQPRGAGLEELKRASEEAEEVELELLIDQVGLDRDEAYLRPSSGENIAGSYELDPDDFLRFAKEDQEESNRGRVNALSNAKRAVDCQATIALRATGIADDGGSVPAKLRALRDVGFIAPTLLRRANQLRNKLEHEYRAPSFREVQDALEIASLFVEAVSRTLWMFPTEFIIGSGPIIENPGGHSEPKQNLLLRFQSDEDKFEVHGARDGLPVNRAFVSPDQPPAYRSLIGLALVIDRSEEERKRAISRFFSSVSASDP